MLFMISFGISLALFLSGHRWVVIKTTFAMFCISSNFKFNVNALSEFVHSDIRLSINMFNICLLLITRASAVNFFDLRYWSHILSAETYRNHTCARAKFSGTARRAPPQPWIAKQSSLGL